MAVILSFHVCNVPCPEEVMAGVQANYDAYFVEIPDSYFPKGLMEAMNNGRNRQVTGIAIHRKE